MARSFLYSNRALHDSQKDVGYLIELRRVLRLLGIEPNDVSINHPGERFTLMGMQFTTTYNPRAAVDRFLDDELGIPYVNTAFRHEGDTLVNTIRSQAWRTIHPQVSSGRDPGDECSRYTG